MENNGSPRNKTRVPVKINSLILGICFLIIGSIDLFIDKEDFFHFTVFIGLYFMFEAFKERLRPKFGQKNIKILEYILVTILMIAVAFTIYLRYIK